jgi:hypothetical protein
MQESYGKWFSSRPINAGKVMMSDSIGMLKDLQSLLEAQIAQDLRTEAVLMDMQSQRLKGEVNGGKQ